MTSLCVFENVLQRTVVVFLVAVAEFEQLTSECWAARERSSLNVACRHGEARAREEKECSLLDLSLKIGHIIGVQKVGLFLSRRTRICRVWFPDERRLHLRWGWHDAVWERSVCCGPIGLNEILARDIHCIVRFVGRRAGWDDWDRELRCGRWSALSGGWDRGVEFAVPVGHGEPQERTVVCLDQVFPPREEGRGASQRSGERRVWALEQFLRDLFPSGRLLPEYHLGQ